MKKGFTLLEILVVIAIIAILSAILFPVFSSVKEKARQTTCLNNIKQLGMGMQMYIDDNHETLPVVYEKKYEDEGLSRWQQKIYPYVKNQQVYICPNRDVNADPRFEYTSPHSLCAATPGYGMNYEYNNNVDSTKPYKLSQIKKPSEAYIILEATGNQIGMKGALEPCPAEGNIPGLGKLYNMEKDPHPYGIVEADEDFVTPRHGDIVSVAYVDGHAEFLLIEDIVKEAENKSPCWLGY